MTVLKAVQVWFDNWPTELKIGVYTVIYAVVLRLTEDATVLDALPEMMQSLAPYLLATLADILAWKLTKVKSE